jgi:hypothetical protein
MFPFLCCPPKYCHTIQHHTPENVAAGSSKHCCPSAELYSTTSQKLWQQILPKHCYPSTELHRTTPHTLRQQGAPNYCYSSTELHTITPPDNHLTLYTMLSSTRNSSGHSFKIRHIMYGSDGLVYCTSMMLLRKPSQNRIHW